MENLKQPDLNYSHKKENADLFKLLVEGVKDYGIFMLDNYGIITTWNEGARRIKGYEEYEVVGKHFSIFYSEEDKNNNKPAFELEKAKVAGSYEDKGWRLKKDGTKFWANVIITAIYETDGTLRGFAKVTRDITIQKNIQEENRLLNKKLKAKVKALKKSKAKLAAIIENAEGMFWSVDAQGRLKAFNPAFAENYKELRMRAPEEDEVIYENYTESDKEVIGYYNRALAGEKIVYERAVNVHGKIRYVRVSFNPIIINNKVTGLSCFALDLTDKILTEQKLNDSAIQLKNTIIELEKVFNYSVDMICTIDAEGRFINLSKASERILGYKPEELVGTKVIDLVIEEDREKSAKFKEKAHSGELATNFGNNYYSKDGRIVSLAWSVYWSAEEETMFCVARDATEQKRLEKAYKSEQDRFADLFFQAPVCIRIFKGKDHVYEMANPLYLKTFGKYDVIGKTAMEVFPEAEEQGFLRILNEVYETGNSFSGKEMPVRVDREGSGKLTDVYINFVYQAYKNKEGNIEGVVFFGTDVTEQVQSRRKIEESEKRYSYLIQNLPAAIYTSDSEGRIMLYNKAAAELWGNEPEPGKDFWCSDCKTYNADGTLLPFDFSPMALTLKESRPILGDEIIIESVTASRSHVLPYSTPTFDAYGNLTGAVNMLINISGRKEAEEKLRISNERFEIVTKATNDAIWDWNLETASLYWNKSYERLFGYPRLVKPQNIEEWLEKIHPEDRDRVKNGLLQKIKVSDRNYWQDEYRFIKADGQIANVCNRGFILFDTHDKPVRFVGAMQDITERKKTELERERLIEHLTHSNRDLQQFNYITSHNLRAPLSNLIGLLNMVDYHSLNEDNKEIFSMFKSSTKQLDQTINDLNQILIIKDNVNIQKTKININAVFESVCKYFAIEIERLSVSINTHFACEEVTFNKSYLESVLTNLMSNAIKYCSPKRQLKINIATERKEDENVLLTFADNGIGIDLKRNKERLFGLYQRFHSNTTGKGLGLFITKSQITSLGGDIEVESAPDKGTTFYITFKAG